MGGDEYFHRSQPLLRPTGLYVTAVGPVAAGGSKEVTYRGVVFNSGAGGLLEPTRGFQDPPETLFMTNFIGLFRADNRVPRTVFHIGILH